MRQIFSCSWTDRCQFRLLIGDHVIPMHGIIILTLAVSSGVLMLCGIVHFGKTADKDQ